MIFKARMVTVAVLLTLVSTPTMAESKHAVAPVSNWAHLHTDSDQVFDLLSIGVNYTYYKGADFGFFGLANVIFPLGAFQDGEYYSSPDYYSKIFGFDVFLCLGGNVKISEKLGIVPAAGMHFNGLRLSGEKYESFYSLTAGLGIAGLLYYNLTETLFMGGFISTAIDFLDFIYEENDLKIGVILTIGLTIGIYFI
ncbi:MAG: hypothetical protein GY847_00330 [Proteobacteria bacterium]|nr:hypothetical protein [Pseudomonadota bacterium]